mmetsp:Transcript_86416/g.180924  ORF Transcript_86416/g.180924 Transcript_86416/m.180924 type:complete len:338 (-) Transcript_86416:28-1041(-)
MTAVLEDKYEPRRQEILAASLQSANTRGWGYFGLTGPLAIGDNSYAPRLMKKAPVEDGADMTRNIQASASKKGASTDVYFQFETPLANGDPYQDPQQMNRKGKLWMIDPDAAFKPAGAIKRSTNKLGYNYVDHCDSAKDPKQIREQYKDFMPPRQIYTNAAKKGGGGVFTKGVLFGWTEDRLFVEHVPDDYDAAKKMRAKDLEEHKAKLQEPPFKGMHYGNVPFANNVDTYHYDIPTHVPRDKVPEDTSRRLQHESPFRPSHPSKKGVPKGLMGGIPEYIEDPVPGGATRKPPPPDDAPPAFKNGMPHKVCNPMPSVVTNLRNMRNERPSSFARPVL